MGQADLLGPYRSVRQREPHRYRGFNNNDLLPHLDWDLIAAKPKFLCGYADITAPWNGIASRAGLATYSEPHWSSFGMWDRFDLTQQWFLDALVDGYRMELTPSPV